MGTQNVSGLTRTAGKTSELGSGKSFDRALECLWVDIGRLTPEVVIAGDREHVGRVDGITLRAGTYNGSKQIELTVPGESDTQLHLVATFGKDGERSIMVDLLNPKQEGIGFTAPPDSEGQWHTTDGLMDEDIDAADVSDHLTERGFVPERPLAGEMKRIFDNLISLASGAEALEVLLSAAPRPERPGPMVFKDEFER